MADEHQPLTVPGWALRLTTIALIPACGWIWQYGQSERNMLNNKIDQAIKDRQVSEANLFNTFRDEAEEARDKQETLLERIVYVEGFLKLPKLELEPTLAK